VVLVQRGNPPKRFASGTLVGRDIVLCAAHSLANLTPTTLEILLCFECDQNTAPSGRRGQYLPGGIKVPREDRLDKWKSCSLISTDPQAKVVQVLEQGHQSDIDYALLRIEWKSHLVSTREDALGVRFVTLPRKVFIPEPSRRFTDELLLIGYPHRSSGPIEGEPAQAVAGEKIEEKGPHPGGGGEDYGYAQFMRMEAGWSGGGVFNEQGRIIGVLKGKDLKDRTAFLNLSQAAEKTIVPNNPDAGGRLNSWLNAAHEPRHSNDPGGDYILLPV